jgi:hypothetical protein
MNRIKTILPIIVIAQFCCTSLGLQCSDERLVINFGLSSTAVGQLTAAVQFGFILGTLVFALLAIADRFFLLQKYSDIRINLSST